ncbi:MAG: NHLP leader peptide family RiPP precursor [Rhodoferax sp.]
MNQETQSNQINSILAKCWADANFKKQLLTDPTAVLKAEGIEIPAGYTVRVLENTDKVLNYILPPNPNAELSDAELETVAGGKAYPYWPVQPVGGGHGTWKDPGFSSPPFIGKF